MIKLKDILKKDKEKLSEDYKNSEWEVYLKDEKGREKIVKKAKSKRAATILYNRIIKSDDYFEVGMRVVKEGKLNEGVDFRVTVEDRKGKLIQGGNFTLKSDANLYIKDMIKKHKLKREKGFWGNRKTGVELSTNF